MARLLKPQQVGEVKDEKSGMTLTLYLNRNDNTFFFEIGGEQIEKPTFTEVKIAAQQALKGAMSLVWMPVIHVKGGQRIDVWAVAPEKVHALREAAHEAANVARVLADDRRSELRIDDSARRRATGVTEAFAPAFEPLIGDDPHE